MNSLRYCSVCGLEPHSIAQCRDPQIKAIWDTIFRLADLESPEAIHNLDDVRSFLEIEVESRLLRAVGVQYAGSQENDSLDDHITHIIDNIQNEIDVVYDMTLEMRNQYLCNQYPDIYQLIPPQEERQEEECGITIEIVLSFVPETKVIECPVCFEDTTFHSINKTKCQHEFCHSCLIRHMSTNMTCPLCRTYINHLQVKSVIQKDAIGEACSLYYQQFDSSSDYDDLPDLIDIDDEYIPPPIFQRITHDIGYPIESNQEN